MLSAQRPETSTGASSENYGFNVFASFFFMNNEPQINADERRFVTVF
jgi:hypothetical protein